MEASAKPTTYEPDEVEAKLKEHGLDDWYLEGDWIRRKYNTDGWPSTLMVVNAVGYVCEAAYHHADLAVTWGKLWVKLQNHAAGGITDKDFAVARQIEDTVLWRPATTARWRGPRTSSCSARAAARPRRRAGERRDGRSIPVRDRQARGARAARDAAASRAAVRVRRRGHEDHGRRADDPGLDRPPARGPARGHADHDPGHVPGRPRGAQRAVRRPGREGPRRPQAPAGVLRPGRRALALRRARHPRLRRDQQRPAPRPRADRRGGELLPRRRRRRHRPRALARPQLARRGTGGDRRPQGPRLHAQHRHARPRRDPHGRRGRRGLRPQPQRAQPPCGAAAARDARC